jgi:hypothetical protein
MEVQALIRGNTDEKRRWRSERTRVSYLRWKLCTGRLPSASAPRIYGAPGIGGDCDACDQLLEHTQLVMSVPWPSQKTFAHLHADCYMLWERERRGQHQLNRFGLIA